MIQLDKMQGQFIAKLFLKEKNILVITLNNSTLHMTHRLTAGFSHNALSFHKHTGVTNNINNDSILLKCCSEL